VKRVKGRFGNSLSDYDGDYGVANFTTVLYGMNDST
jgi:hypothetical protein